MRDPPARGHWSCVANALRRPSRCWPDRADCPISQGASSPDRPQMLRIPGPDTGLRIRPPWQTRSREPLPRRPPSRMPTAFLHPGPQRLRPSRPTTWPFLTLQPARPPALRGALPAHPRNTSHTPGATLQSFAQGKKLSRLRPGTAKCPQRELPSTIRPRDRQIQGIGRQPLRRLHTDQRTADPDRWHPPPSRCVTSRLRTDSRPDAAGDHPPPRSGAAGVQGLGFPGASAPPTAHTFRRQPSAPAHRNLENAHPRAASACQPANGRRRGHATASPFPATGHQSAAGELLDAPRIGKAALLKAARRQTGNPSVDKPATFKLMSV